ncbi:unnamed protein product [Angiostrongylus costaricensis]|uniref:Nodulin-like domain-containing protein n=1 Tax=Angiostrongylus costaricensis TaxID=334426 RepID=A0A158PJG7_ANGCS|nr:unnamed protein product [Angiostrongylus costaricensis]
MEEITNSSSITNEPLSAGVLVVGYDFSFNGSSVALCHWSGFSLTSFEDFRRFSGSPPLVVYCMLQIIVGWSVSRFGLYGLLEPTEVKHSVLNYIGVIVTLISGVLFIFVKQANERSLADGTDVDETAQELTIKAECRGEHVVLNTTSDSNTSETTEKRNQCRKKPQLVGIAMMGEVLRKKFRYLLMTMGLATLHGLMMTPIEKLKQRHPSEDLYQALDYVWSFYSSVFVASTIYFFLYCVIRRKEAYVNSALVLPSVGYGVLWTTGMTMWMLSSGVLLQVIAYPIVTRVCI